MGNVRKSNRESGNKPVEVLLKIHHAPAVSFAVAVVSQPVVRGGNAAPARQAKQTEDNQAQDSYATL